MCNTYEKRFKTCGCVMRQIFTHHWDLCDRARKAWKGGETYELSKCSFGVFSEAYHDIEGRCSKCAAKWAKSVDSLEEKAMGDWKKRAEEKDKENLKGDLKGTVEGVEKIR